jgi:hypothetical protein
MNARCTALDSPRGHLAALGIAAIATMGALLAGCANVLNLEDRTLDETDAATVAPRDHDASTGVSDAAPAADAARDGSGEASSVARDAAPGDAAADAPSCSDPCDMADGLNQPYVMTSDAYNVYWVDFGDAIGAGNGKLKSCGVGGCGGAPTVWHSGLMDPRGIAVDATNVYWATTWGGVAGAMGAIWSCGLSAGSAGCTNPTRLASALDPDGIAIDTAYVYWVDPNVNAVHRVRTTGAGNDELLYGMPDGGLGVFLDDPVSCAVDGSTLYIIDGSANVYSMPKGGGTPSLLSNGSGINAGIAVDGLGATYFGEQGFIFSGDSSGASSVIPIVIDGNGVSVNQPVSLAVDVTAQMLYWADWGSGLTNDGAVGRSTLIGNSPTLLQSSLETPTSVTVSGDYAYWLSAGTLLSSTSTTTSYVQTNTGKLWRTHK